MLKQRTLIILALAVLVLLGISLLQRATHRRTTARPDAAPLLATTPPRDDVTRITLGHGADTLAVVLERLPDGWVVRTAHGHRANPQRVDDMLTAVLDLAGEFRSESADVLPDYGLTDDEAVRIALFGKDYQPLLELLVGKRPTGATGNFVRRAGSDRVYLSRAGVLGTLGLYGGPARPTSRHFLELLAYQADRNEVDAITLLDGARTVALRKVIAAPPAPAPGDTAAPPPAVDRSVYEWRLTAPHERPALKTKADAVLNGATNIRAVDIADPQGDLMAYGLWRAGRTVELTFQDGKTFTLFFGATRPEEGDAPGGIYMRTDADNTIWVIRESLVNTLFPATDELTASG